MGCRDVTAAADGGAITSDAGALLLREAERSVNLIAGLAACFEDGRDPRRVEHELGALVRQRVYALALGYEDVNDHERLRFDPMLQILSGKLAPTRRKGGPALAGKSTLNRLERLAAEGDERYHKIAYRTEGIDRLLVDNFLRSQKRAPSRIVLDIDATDDPVHGCPVLPRLSRSLLLPSALHLLRGFPFVRSASALQHRRLGGVVEELERIVAQIRARWPQVSILLRADSDFSREWSMAWCEAQGVDYVFQDLAGSGEGRAGRSEGASSEHGEGGAVIPVVSSPDAYILEPGAAGGRQGRAPGQGRQSALHRDFAGRGGDRREASVRAPLLRPGDDGEPAQGAAARPVRGPDVVHADALQSVGG